MLAREVEGVTRADRPDLERLDRVRLVVDGACGAREVQDRVDVPVDGDAFDHVVLDQREPRCLDARSGLRRCRAGR